MRNPVGNCIICKVKLKPLDNEGSVQKCMKCKRDYFLKTEIVDQSDDLEFIHEDYDAELEGTQGITEGGLLVSSSHETDHFELKSSTKESDYEKQLRKHFGEHVEIRTKES